MSDVAGETIVVDETGKGDFQVEVDRGPEHLRWFWALHFPSKPENLRTDNRVATLEEAKAQFQKCWDAWKAWAKMEEVP
jgi:hypothetical protein